MRASCCITLLLILGKSCAFLTPAPLSLAHQRRCSFRGSSCSSRLQVKADKNNENNNDEPSKNWLEKATEVLQRPVELKFPWKGLGIFTVGSVAGVVLSTWFFLIPFTGGFSADVEKSMILFENVMLDIKRSYVEEVDTQKLLQTAVAGMLRTLDPYTEFENVEQALELQESVSGQYGGVGLVISGDRLPATDKRTGKGTSKGGIVPPPAIPSRGIQVISAFEGYAFDAGMRPGDRLISVGGVSLDGLTVEGVKDLLRGAPDTEVAVKFTREGLTSPAGPVPQEVMLRRTLVKLRDVRLSTLAGDGSDGIAYVQLAGFSQGAGTELATALQNLNQQSPEGLKGLILDLRGNPGGLLESAVDVSALLVPQGSDIVSAKGRAFGEVRYKSAMAPLLPPQTPLVVLTNSGTASAAEIVSGAVQDLDAGVIVGLGKGRTYGKGLVQSIKELPYNSALKFTVAKYYTPSGRCIQSVDYSNGGVATAVSTVGDAPTTIVPSEQAPDVSIPLPQQPDVSLDDLPLAPEPPRSPLMPPVEGTQKVPGGSNFNDMNNKGGTTNKQRSVNGASLNQQQQQQQQQKSPLRGTTAVAATAAESDAPAVVIPLEKPLEKPLPKQSSGGAPSLIYSARAVKDEDRKVFKTLRGRTVRDGGGVEGDINSPERRPSSLEIALLLQGAYFDYAGQWAATHTFTGSQSVATDATLKEFKQFVLAKQQSKEYRLEALYEPQLDALEGALEGGGLKNVATMRVAPLRAAILDEMAKDFELQREPIRTALEGAILSRYLPESMLLRSQLAKDDQFQLALSIAKNRPRYESIIAAPASAIGNSQQQLVPPFANGGAALVSR